MSAGVASKVALLLYEVMPPLNLAQMVADLGSIGLRLGTADPNVSWDCDDIATVDFGNTRLVIGFSDALPGRFVACITVASGSIDSSIAQTTQPTDAALLSDEIIEKLKLSFPSDDTRFFSSDRPLTPDLIDQIVEDLVQGEAADPARSKSQMPEGDGVTNKADLPADDPGDMERLIHRLSSELTTRSSGLISRAIASATQKKNRVAAKDAASSLPLDAKGTAKLARQKAKGTGGLFWHAGDASPIATNPGPDPAAPKVATTPGAGELKAVRDALYALDQSQSTPAARLAAQAQRALQAVAAIPMGLSGKIAGKQKRDTAQVPNRTKP